MMRSMSTFSQWLRALPVTALGLRMDDHTVRVYVWEQQLAANSVGLLWEDMHSAVGEAKEDINGTPH